MVPCYFSSVVLTSLSTQGLLCACPLSIQGGQLQPSCPLPAAIPGDTFLISWVTSLEAALWTCTPLMPVMGGNRNCV